MEYEELKSYLKDVSEVEQQRYTLQLLADAYKKEIYQLNENIEEVPINTDDVLENIHVSYANMYGGVHSFKLNVIIPPSEFATRSGFNDMYPEYLELDSNRISKRWQHFFEDMHKRLEPHKKKHSLFSKPSLSVQDLNLGGVGHKVIVDLYTEYYNEDLEKRRTYFIPICEKTTKEYTEQILVDLSSTNELLEKLYAMDIIHPKYRNLVAVTQIYEYLETGRCTELSGPNGAYNLFEQELRLNIIITQLDRIISQLDQLNATMSYVAYALNQSNSILRNISSTLRSIDTNTALTAYNSQCIAHNTRIASQYVL